jgi:hypothetical protein
MGKLMLHKVFLQVLGGRKSHGYSKRVREDEGICKVGGSDPFAWEGVGR